MLTYGIIRSGREVPQGRGGQVRERPAVVVDAVDRVVAAAPSRCGQPLGPRQPMPLLPRPRPLPPRPTQQARGFSRPSYLGLAAPFYGEGFGPSGCRICPMPVGMVSFLIEASVERIGNNTAPAQVQGLLQVLFPGVLL